MEPEPSSSKVLEVEKKVDDVKRVMVDNMEKMLERGERIELLQDKTTLLSDGASRFQGQVRRMRNSFWFQQKKAMFYALGGLAALIALILWVSRTRNDETTSAPPPPSTIP